MDNAVPFPLPGVRRFRQLGFGMFVHFGLYSQPERGVRVFRPGPAAREACLPLANRFPCTGPEQVVTPAKAAAIRLGG